MDEEAKAQVVTGEGGDVVTQPLARPQPLERRCSHLRPGGVVADERDPALGGHVARLRLGDVVEQRPEAQCLATGQLVGERFVEYAANRRPVLTEPTPGSRTSEIVSFRTARVWS